MEPLRLKPRQPVTDEVENWDDDLDLVIDADDLNFRSTSTLPTTAPPRRRDSTSSHLSLRSDLESWNGEEQHVHIPGDDEKSTLDAITAAENAGIPLPKNVPSSALMGGTIRRLGGKKIRRIIQDDWENDLELPDTSQGLTIKAPNHTEFPETLRQVSGSSTHSSPTKPRKLQPAVMEHDQKDLRLSGISILSANAKLDKFVEDEDDDFFGDGGDTIKFPKTRQQAKPVSFITPPTPQKADKAAQPDDDFENDLELPSDGKLKLSMRRDIPKTPSSQSDDLDWGEGSLGTRYGGTRRDGRSNRSSSASALSPSISSSITAESEDETFEGLVLPTGPVNFQERLQHRRKSRSPVRIEEEPDATTKKSPPRPSDQADFFEGLDLGDGEVFDSGKLTLHRNVKIKETRPASPARPKAAVSLTFTNKPAVSTRIPRLSHERAHSTSLEPVSESGGPIPQRSRRSQSRLGHSAQSSLPNLPTTTSPQSTQGFPPSTPRRREVGAKTSMSSLRCEPTTTSAQLLKQKRSLPAIRALHSPVKSSNARAERPPSRTELNRPPSVLRPKTPVERSRGAINESPAVHASARKPHAPFIATGGSQRQSQVLTSKSSRTFRRHDSDNSIDLRPQSRAFSRSTMRSPSPQRYRVAADTWERLSKPKNKKQFGDGHELDGFDDLPTSREVETKFLKQPAGSGTKNVLRNKISSGTIADRISTPTPATPYTPARMTHIPHFARDTAASRIARETSLAHRGTGQGPLAPLTTQRVAQLSTRSNLSPQPQSPMTPTLRKRSKRPIQSKPHLITNMNSGKESKMVGGMYYNAETYRWEGNENALNVFDPPLTTPTTTTLPPHLTKEKEVTSTPRPALITNISATKGVQVVGGMVFDPQNMCWLKIGPNATAKSEASDTLDGFDALEDEDDVFKDIPDLDDTAADDQGGKGRVSDIKDDWLVGEEFDVGPEFVRRQREEEDRWRRKCEKWVSRGPRDRDAWRWTIRELVSQFDDFSM
ncbi:Protein byr4 [Paramyrothecium foliicola]|nr:Protein byr4 [Paramyrothecium foliicola]